MADATSTPRVSSQYLGQYINRNVIIVGKVLQLRGESAVMDSNGNVTLNLNRVRVPSRPVVPFCHAWLLLRPASYDAG